MEKSTAKISQETYKTDIYTAQHQFIVDEPEELGGKNLGPSPFELLSSALAACTAITLKMYSQRKEWPVENIEVEVTFERDAASNTTNFKRSIVVHGDLDETQKSRLLAIANSCPVHKILSGTSVIESTLA